MTAFVGASSGPWAVERLEAVSGTPLAPASHLSIVDASTLGAAPIHPVWILGGVTSNERYVTRAEHDALALRQEPIGRAAATRAALIPIRKMNAWWELAQDERRWIFEETSHHIAIGLGYLPAVARRLYHARDLGEPFDFLTWFEFAPEAAPGFEELVARLRATDEWRYVEREIDIRLTR